MVNRFSNHEIQKIMVDAISLEYPPIAVKLVRTDEELPERFAKPKIKIRYCQLLMEAKRGHSLMLTTQDISCPAAASAFGFTPLPEKIRSGEMLCALGLFDSKDAAAKMMGEMPRLQLGSHKAVVASPLEHAGFKPDVVVVEGKPEQIMWISLATLYSPGGRLYFDSAVFQACCVDVTVIPYMTGKVNVSMGCYGCRGATDMKDDECLVGVPIALLDSVVHGLEQLSKKAILDTRQKGVYRAYSEHIKDGE